MQTLLCRRLDHQAEYREAAPAVIKKFYIDDYSEFFQNGDHALELVRDLVSLPKLGGFNLAKLGSNELDITTALDPDTRESHSSFKDLCKSPDQSSHVLVLK